MSTRLEREYLEANSIEELNHALLVSAATQGDMHSVRELVEAKQTDVNYINEATRKFYARQAGTALLAACENNRTEVALYLLTKGADPSISGRLPFTGMTALHFIAFYGNTAILHQVVNALRSKNGNEALRQCLTARDRGGLLPIHWAAWSWQVDVIEELLNLGNELGEDWTNVASVIESGHQGVRSLTPVHMSMMCQHAQCLLDNLSADYKHFLAEVSNTDLDEHRLARVTELFLDRGGDFMKGDGRLITPLHYLALEGDTWMIDTVLSTYLKWKGVVFDDAEQLKEVSEELWQSRDIYTQNIFDISYERGNFEDSHVIQRLVKAWMGLSITDSLKRVKFDAFARLRTENSTVQQERLEELTKNCACELIECTDCHVTIKNCLKEDHHDVCLKSTCFVCPSRAYGCKEVFKTVAAIATHLQTSCQASRVVCKCQHDMFAHEYSTHYFTEHVQPKSLLSVVHAMTDVTSVEDYDIVCPACRMIIPVCKREQHVCAVTAVVAIDPIDIV